MSSKKQLSVEHGFSAAEQRAARAERDRVSEAVPYGWIAERVSVSEAEPYGWIAESESGKETYILYSSPYTKRLVCTCADYIYRGKDDSAYECKHVSAVLKFIGRWYLVNDYDPLRQICKSA
jgi:hypothetical protein